MGTTRDEQTSGSVDAVRSMDAVRSVDAVQSRDSVRLVYHYRDGHDFTTETMLRADALAYMPLLNAVQVDDEHYEAPVAVIELRAG